MSYNRTTAVIFLPYSHLIKDHHFSVFLNEDKSVLFSTRFFISNSIFGVNVRRFASKLTFSRLNVAQEFLSNFQNVQQFLAIFLLLPLSASKNIVHNTIVPKIVLKKFSYSELKIEKVKYFTQSSTKNFCSSVLLSKLLNFQTIFNVRPLETWLLIKKAY